ncbi:DUF5658 family protein [Clostridium sardiniense]|uniref:DUF5658 family protein n=1 Tax=Clostridium sardiniense TaxID=29369 RepID=UPI003D355D70
MIKYIINNSYSNVKSKLKVLYMLNITDIIFTIILLRTGLFKEVNSIMFFIVDSLTLSILVKVCLVGILIYYLIKRMMKATYKQLKVSNIIIIGAIFIFLIINISHIIYSILYLFMANVI